jgi:hypothetical protein
MTLYDLNSLPNFITIFIVIILAYLTYQVYQYRKVLLTVSLVAVICYMGYLFYEKQELTKEVKQITYTKATQDFNNTKSLGYSLNNPGNIRNSRTSFQGEIQSDKPFKKFSNMAYGFRAMTSLLHNYIKSGYNTVDKILNRYAPTGDGNNNPRNYVAAVTKAANVKPDQLLTDADFKNGNMLNIMYHMTKVEQGYPPNIQDLVSGFNMYTKEEFYN